MIVTNENFILAIAFIIAIILFGKKFIIIIQNFCDNEISKISASIEKLNQEKDTLSKSLSDLRSQIDLQYEKNKVEIQDVEIQMQSILEDGKREIDSRKEKERLRLEIQSSRTTDLLIKNIKQECKKDAVKIVEMYFTLQNRSSGVHFTNLLILKTLIKDKVQ